MNLLLLSLIWPLFLFQATPHFTPWDGWIIYGATFLAALAAIYKTAKAARPVIREFREAWAKFLTAGDKVNALATKVDEINKEVRPNGGNSMRDVINRVEQSVTRVEVRQDAHISLSDDALWETNAQGQLVKANKKFLELVDRNLEEVIGLNWKNTIHPDDAAVTASLWAQAVADQRDSEFHYRVVRPDGRILPIFARAVVRFDHRGQVVGWFGNIVVRVEESGPPRPIVQDEHRKRILIVEDGLDFRTLCKLALGKEYEVEAHENGNIALQEFRAAQMMGKAFDLIILDFSMPGMDGMQTAQAIRNEEKRFGKTPIVFLTGTDTTTIDQSGLRENRISDIWEKPMDVPELLTKVEKIIGK